MASHIVSLIAILAVCANGSPTSRHSTLRRQDNGTLVDSSSLQAAIKIDALLEKSQDLQDIAYATPGRNRVFGSQGHNDTVAYIVELLSTPPFDDYYNVSTQSFSAEYSAGNASLSVDSADRGASLVTYSPSGTVSAPIVQVSNLGCSASDFPSNVSGAIALIERGTCEFGLKAAYAGAAGAAGAVIYNNAKGSLSGTLGSVTRPEGAYPPTVGIDLEQGQALIELLAGGEIVGELEVLSIIENRTTYNVIAQTKGGDANNVLMLGGHSDSVEEGPGINDDGSGSIGILEVALQLAQFSVNNAVRFAWWSAEEFGLLGSEHYVASASTDVLSKIRLYLNFDMIASPNFIYAIYDGDGSAFNISGPAGSAEAEALFENYFKDKGLPSQATEFDGRSDYGPFLDAGIPAGGLFTGAEQIKTAEEATKYGGQAGVATDANYHAAGDTTDNLNATAFLVNAQGIAHAVATYGRSFDSLPARNSTKAKLARSPVVSQKRMKERMLPHAYQRA
ncbi:putative leucine aminopeptidase 2 [Phyllosticta citrichinensis]|uniref:Peptide hydrolase n=1 Tax=Phyllosticta citrichinensis TaxID=1130410 RepID=A0ABR1XXW9_9PEZI